MPLVGEKVVGVTSNVSEETYDRISAGAISPQVRGTAMTAMTGATATSMANLGYIDEEEDEPLPWSGGYVVACLLLPMVNGCLSKSFWPCFTLYYVAMSWPLWRCGLAISSGALVHCLMQQVLEKAGLWTSLPVALIHLIFAILALVYITEEWAIFTEMVCLLGLDAKVAIEGLAFDWFQSEHSSYGLQASASVITSFTVSHVLSFSLGGIIYNFTAWEGKRMSSFLVATTVTASRTTAFTSAPSIKKRVSSWSQRGSTVSMRSVEGRFVVDKDLRLALAARTSSHWGLKEVDADLRFPMTLVACTNWVSHFSMLSQLSTFALLLARHGWSSAAWAGVVQSCGEVLCILVTLLKGCFSLDEDLDEEAADDPPKRGALSRCFSFVFSEPYNVSVYLLLFATMNFCLIIPDAAGVVAAQVLFSSTCAFADKAAHDMYVLYSCIGNPDMLYTVVSLGYGGAVIGGIMAGVLTLSLFEIDAMIPFLILGGLCFMICLQYTAGFCCRVGTDILTSEADRE